MSIQKSKTLLNGSTGDYWKISQAKLDKENMQCEFTIVLFLSQALAAAHAPGLGESRSYTKEMTSEELQGNIIEQGYAFIKSVDAELSDGIDV